MENFFIIIKNNGHCSLWNFRKDDQLLLLNFLRGKPSVIKNSISDKGTETTYKRSLYESYSGNTPTSKGLVKVSSILPILYKCFLRVSLTRCLLYSKYLELPGRN